MNTQIDAPTKEQIRASRLKLILVLGCFLGPLAVAFIWYYGFGAQMLSSSRVNHAKLISPVVTLQSFSEKDTSGDTFSSESLKKKWTVFHVIPEDCTEQCQTALYNSRQTRSALGKDTHRLFRVIFISDSYLTDTLQSDHPDARFISLNNSELANQFRSIMTKSNMGEYDAILVDPLSNAMMFIPVDLNPSLLLKDLKKLLKLSKIG